MTEPGYWLPLGVFLLLILADRPCSACGRLWRHRLDCRRRPAHRV